jgi:hypothetical protein
MDYRAEQPRNVLSRSRRHGIALLLVLTVVGLASLIGMAMLSGASLQAEVAHSTAKSAAADYLSDAAVQTATYYLQRNLANMPASWGTQSGYAIYATNVTVSGVGGSFDVNAAATSVPNQYLITAVGRSGGTTPMTRTATAKVNVLRATPTYASGFGGTTTVLGTKTYFANGAAVAASGTISNSGSANFAGGIQIGFGGSQFSPPASMAGQINYYGGDVANGTYTMPSGDAGTPQKLVSSGSYTISNANTFASSLVAGNPGHVFYFPGDLIISGAGSYNATFVVRGKVQINAAPSASLTFNRQSGFPAFVTDGSMVFNTLKSGTLTINGVAYLGGGTGWGAGTNVQSGYVNLNGALLMPGSKQLNNPGMATMTITYTPANVDITNLTTTTQPGIGVRFVSWGQ